MPDVAPLAYFSDLSPSTADSRSSSLMHEPCLEIFPSVLISGYISPAEVFCNDDKIIIAAATASFINPRVAPLQQQRSQNRLPDFWDTFRWAVHLYWLASLALVAIALWLWGAVEVRGHVGEVFFLTFLGCAWLAVGNVIFPWLGLSALDDVIERKNPAALVAHCGACAAVAITYAGGSLGEGPSYGNNIFSAALGTVGLLAVWILLELGGKVSVSITEERDLASGVRLGGFLLAASLILGRAVAGNWHSESETVHDFYRDSWPAAVLVVIATSVERWVRPSRARPFPEWRSCGLLPALVYLALAAAWLCYLGRWEGMP